MNNKLPGNKLEAVIFDMDGVLVDSEPVYYKVEQELFKSLGLNISREVHHTFVGMSMQKIWENIKETSKIDLSVEELISLHKKLMIRGFKSVKDPNPITGIIPLLKLLLNSNIKIALASSSSHELIEVILKRIDLKKYFQLIISGEDVKYSKPEPDIFLKTIQMLQVDKSNAVIIEDSANGVKAARLAGIPCIAYLNPNSGQQDLTEAAFIIKDFQELNQLIREHLRIRN